MELPERIQQLFEQPPAEFTDEHHALFAEFKQKLNSGEARAAERVGGQWRVNHWVKRGILLGFKLGRVENFSISQQMRFYDKHTYPLKRITIDSGVRIVPGGSSIRDGCYVGRGVTWCPFHFAGWFMNVDQRSKYPRGADPIVLGESVNTITTYGYDPVTGMQEPKATLCQVRAA